MAETNVMGITLLEVSQALKEITTNEALDTLDKILGVVEVTTASGTEALSEDDGANGLIRITSTLTNDLLVTIPARYIAGWRVVSNESSGSFAVDVQFVGGAASVEIPQGEAAIFFDGAIIQMGSGVGGGGLTEIEIVKEAIQGSQPVSNPASWDKRNEVWVADFDAGTDEALIFGVQIPDTWDGGNIVADVYFYMTSATSGDVIWQGAWERGNTDIDADSFAAAQSSAATTVNGTAGIMIKAPITFTAAQIDGLVAGEPARFKLNRDANAAGDTATGDAELVKVVFRIPVA